ncbi:putative oxidoreductase, chloroplastic [Porphyridium purpureum]|uniref:Putative oxidoreductase, chloroplastic n=1 Tax=Porphyridium purpureum TaxID=35688 RepID=A0A5J4Z3E7_PORPP|nr:putative oxidoreductase, chloroplastic [Porphyridium purpureum]|eukprot:POR3799..scf295_1
MAFVGHTGTSGAGSQLAAQKRTHRVAACDVRMSERADAGTPSAKGTASVLAPGSRPIDQEKKLLLNPERGLEVLPVQVGVWSWGDRYWGYGGADFGEQQAQEAYNALLAHGLGWMDSAEVYGLGLSEKLLRKFDDARPRTLEKPMVATKFAPLPWRLTGRSVPGALRASLSRLGRPKVELYMQHWPGFLFNALSNDMYLDGLAQCYHQNLADAIGVSNFQVSRLRAAHARLKADGVPLVSNQVHYSLAYRACERNGVLETCRELGVQLFAYSPLAQGLLTGKYTEKNASKPGGARNLIFNQELLQQVQPTVDALRRIGEERDKSPAQVAINWLLCQGVTPIVGVKTAQQADSLAGAVGWRLNDGEIDELDKMSRKITAMKGFPAENL